LQTAPIVSIVDDDESVRLALRSLVRSLGLIVCAFASAEEFLQSPHVNDTSCLITDVQMPGMSGIELQSVLLAQGRRIPTIFVTAFPEEQVRARALEAGAIDFLSKPFNCQTLIKLIDTALGLNRNA
jgi:FixJ family two-component response regulator